MNTSIKAEQTATTHDQVALLAYQLWKKAGCQHGHDLEYWLQAEKQLKSGLAVNQTQSTQARTTATNNLSRGGNGRAGA